MKFSDRFTFVAATAANHGVGWVTVSPNGKRDDLTLRLVQDDVPIAGEIVDLEGKEARVQLFLFEKSCTPFPPSGGL